MLSFYKIKLHTHRAIWLGRDVLADTVRLRGVAVLCLSLMLVGSCQNVMGWSVYHGEKLNLAELSKGQMYRYAVSVQNAVAENPDMFLKLGAEEVSLILASPDLTRKDGVGGVWQYRTNECVLDVFFASDKIAHYEFRSRKMGSDEIPASETCLRNLYSSRRAQIAKSFDEIFASYESSNAG